MATYTSFDEIRRISLGYIEMAALDCDDLREKVAALLTKDGTPEIDLTDYPEMVADILATFICPFTESKGAN